LLNNNKPVYNPYWGYPIGGGIMQWINISDFYKLGQILQPLSELEAGKPIKDYYYTLIMARSWAEYFVNDKIMPMTICKGAINKIINGINILIPQTPEGQESIDFKRATTYVDLYNIIEGAKEFETVFSAEARNMATYFVSKKGIYDTNDLITKADDLLTEDIKNIISEEAKTDIREAGRCLAFDLATASGFHIARAVEKVLIDYLNVLCPDKVKTLNDAHRNLGGYIKLAKENKCAEKVCNALDQFRDLHRNPLMHPEAVLTINEAIILLGIAQSAIAATAWETKKITSN
jgi:hypothetical protein